LGRGRPPTLVCGLGLQGYFSWRGAAIWHNGWIPCNGIEGLVIDCSLATVPIDGMRAEVPCGLLSRHPKTPIIDLM